jgi:DUF3040 family protein
VGRLVWVMWLVISVLLPRQVGQATPARPSGPGGGSPPDRTDRPFDRTAGSAGSHRSTIWRRQNRGRSRGGRPTFGTVTPKDHDLWLDCWPRRGMEPMLPSRARREGWSASADHGAKGDGMATSSASDANVLSCRERRVLADIEDDLAASDPRGADEMGRRSSLPTPGWWPLSARCTVLLLVLLVLVVASVLVPASRWGRSRRDQDSRGRSWILLCASEQREPD